MCQAAWESCPSAQVDLAARVPGSLRWLVDHRNKLLLGNFQVREGAAKGLAGKLCAALGQMVTTEPEGRRTWSYLSFQTCRKEHR